MPAKSNPLASCLFFSILVFVCISVNSVHITKLDNESAHQVFRTDLLLAIRDVSTADPHGFASPDLSVKVLMSASQEILFLRVRWFDQEPRAIVQALDRLASQLVLVTLPNLHVGEYDVDVCLTAAASVERRGGCLSERRTRVRVVKSGLHDHSLRTNPSPPVSAPACRGFVSPEGSLCSADGFRSWNVKEVKGKKDAMEGKEGDLSANKQEQQLVTCSLKDFLDVSCSDRRTSFNSYDCKTLENASFYDHDMDTNSFLCQDGDSIEAPEEKGQAGRKLRGIHLKATHPSPIS
eukprot:765008-Hanusia_phi.AAC.4